MWGLSQRPTYLHHHHPRFLFVSFVFISISLSCSRQVIICFHLFSCVNQFICFHLVVLVLSPREALVLLLFGLIVSIPIRNHVLARFSSVFIRFHCFHFYLFIIWVCFFILLTWFTAPMCWSGSISLLSLWPSSL